MSPRGPDRQPSGPFADMTKMLDPTEFWGSDCSSCPDWPMLSPTQRVDGPIGRVGAERQLGSISDHLNRHRRELRAPTAEEREAVMRHHFIRGEGTGPERWYRLGILDMKPRQRGLAEDTAHLLIEVLHLRGYLRKLDAVADAQTLIEVDRKQAQLRHVVDNFDTMATRMVAEHASLAAATARHRQRIEDEAAFRRSHDLRVNLVHAHSEASQAAYELGLKPPSMPEFSEG